MKHLILFTVLALISANGMAGVVKTDMKKSTKAEGKGEVETECPWAKQDERNGNTDKAKIFAFSPLSKSNAKQK